MPPVTLRIRSVGGKGATHSQKARQGVPGAAWCRSADLGPRTPEPLELEVRAGGVRVCPAEEFVRRIRGHTPDALIDPSGHAERSGVVGDRGAHGLGHGESALVHHLDEQEDFSADGRRRLY